MARTIRKLEYYLWDDFLPVFLIHIDDGGLQAWVYEGETGGFRSDLGYVKVMFDPYTSSDKLTREQFVQEVEALRGDDVTRGWLTWEGPVVALYETIQPIVDRVRHGGRLDPEDEALVRSLRERTHTMFEAQLRERGGLGLPQVGDPVPVDPRLKEPISPDWRAVPDDLAADIARRAATLAGPLRDRDAEGVASALGWPVTETTVTEHATYHHLAPGLPIGRDTVRITDRDGSLMLEIPLSDSGRDTRPAFSRFLFREYKRLTAAIRPVFDQAPQETGGRWPERSWYVNGVGLFVRRGASCVQLLVMPEDEARARLQQVIRESAAE
ncbi:MAG TPA: DUF6301 family protein [Thermomonospora sp.]|nr:DUF6301 family protein [Thermomonospora sp.]